MSDNEKEAPAAKAEQSPDKTDATQSKKQKKRSAPANHPPCIDMITEAVSVQGEKDGTSYQSIKKYIDANFDFDVESKSMIAHIRKALKNGVTSGKLIQTKGKGANGSFKMGIETSTLASKPTKRQVASAEAAAQREAQEKRFAKAAKQKRFKKKKAHHVAVQKVTARKTIKKPAPKKSSKSKAKPSSKKAVTVSVKKAGRKSSRRR